MNIITKNFPDIQRINYFLFTVMHMFIRVSVAFIKGKPIKKISAKLSKEYAKRCLENKQCKSFNFDELREKCELVSINAEKITLVSGDCLYKDYYQLIGKYIITM